MAASNRIELYGRLLGRPELRSTPAGRKILRAMVDCSNPSGELLLVVVMTDDEAVQAAARLGADTKVRVEGTLRGVKRRLKSGLVETGFEVVARCIKAAEPR